MTSSLTVSTYSENQLFDVRRTPKDEKLLTERNAMTCKKTVFKVAAMWSLTTMVGLISSPVGETFMSRSDIALM